MKNIAEEIKKFNSKENITIDEFCLKIGMTKGGYYNMMNNDSMKVSTLIKIAEIMKVPVTYFFAEKFKDNVSDYQIDQVLEAMKTCIKEKLK